MIYNKLYPSFFFRITFNFDDDYDTQSNRICYSTLHTIRRNISVYFTKSPCYCSI